jgi:serine/threonine protein kinase
MGNNNTASKIQGAQHFLEQKAGLHDFQLVELIGKGAFGEVFKAKLKNDPTESLYAVKIIKADKDQYIPELKTLTYYYNVIQQCCPDCLVMVFPHFFREGFYQSKNEYDEIVEKRFLVIVSQYVPQILEKLKGELQPKEAVRLTLKLVECLKAFSKKGLIYTDLKPANLGTYEEFISCKLVDIGGFKTSKEFFKTVKTLFSAEIRVNPRSIHAPQRNTLPVSTESACERYRQNYA